MEDAQWQTQTLEFTVPASGNYHVGIESGDAKSGWAEIRSADLLGNPGLVIDYPQMLDEKYDKKMYVYPGD